MKIEFNPPPETKKKLAASALAVFLVAAPVGLSIVAYQYGHEAGHADAYQAGYNDGHDAANKQLSGMLTAATALTQPLQLTDDMDCQTLSLIAARAGALEGLEMAKAIVGGP